MIRIELSTGRTREQKLKVAQAITQSVVEYLHCKPETVQIVFIDVEPADWAVAGKLLDSWS
jgi:4-oxalocrotonate tautomerase